MDTLMLQFKHVGPTPSLDEVRRLFNLKDDEIDSGFGVIATDPTENIYTVLIAVSAKYRVETILATRTPDPAEGLFSNPKIEPFDSPKK